MIKIESKKGVKSIVKLKKLLRHNSTMIIPYSKLGCEV